MDLERNIFGLQIVCLTAWTETDADLASCLLILQNQLHVLFIASNTIFHLMKLRLVVIGNVMRTAVACWSFRHVICICEGRIRAGKCSL